MLSANIAHAQEALRSLQARHLARGISWCFYPHDGGIMFHSFGRRSRLEQMGMYGLAAPLPRDPDKGSGAQALTEVCDLADRFNLRITLWTVVPKLYAYYTSFGFEEIEGRDEERRIYARPPNYREHVVYDRGPSDQSILSSLLDTFLASPQFAADLAEGA